MAAMKDIFDNDFLDDITKLINQDMEDAIFGSLLGFYPKQEETSICLEDITKMCAEYGKTPWNCGFSVGYSHQEMHPEHRYDMEYEIKFLDCASEEQESISAAAKYDMAMKAVI